MSSLYNGTGVMNDPTLQLRAFKFMSHICLIVSTIMSLMHLKNQGNCSDASHPIENVFLQ